MKLPINPLLHLVSLAAVAGMVMSGLKLSENTKVYSARGNQIRGDVKTLGEVEAKSASDGWDYSDRVYWTSFTEANFTGKIKVVEQPKGPDDDAAKKPKADVIQLTDILYVMAISHGDGISGAVVNYTGNVEVPTEFQLTNSVLPSLPAGRVGRSKVASLPVRNVASSPPHHLRIGDALWSPYEHVFLHAIAKDASSVDFELKLESKKNDVQTLHKNVLGLPEKIRAELDGQAKARSAKDIGKASKPAAKDESGGYSWVDQPSTFVDRRGNVNISRKDSQWLSRSGGQIFNEDVHMRDYRGGTGRNKVRGILLRQLSPRVRQFGAQVGDVVISINNEPVKGMAQAKRLGRRLYNRGVRSFRVEVQRRGEKQVLFYHMKKDQ